MESRKIEPSGRPSSAKQPYEPPRAILVPLKLEERLLTCRKVTVEFCRVLGGTGES
jgi:hypothetical protein